MGWIARRYVSLAALTNRPMVVMCGVSAIIGLAFSLVQPILPLYAESFGTTLTLVGLLVGALSLARLLGNLPGGYAADVLGYRRVMILSCGVISTAALGAGLTTDFWKLFGFQMLQGIGAAFFHTTGFALMARMSSAASRVRVLTMYQGAFMMAAIVGPTIGGFVAQTWGYRAPFLGFSLLAALAGALVFWGVAKAGHRSEHVPSRVTQGTGLGAPRSAGSADVHQDIGKPARRSGSVFRLLAQRAFVLVTLWGFCTWFARQGLQRTVVPLLGAGRLALSEGEIGLAYTLMGATNLLAMLVVSGPISDRYGRKAVIVPSSCVMAVAFMLFASSQSYPLFLVSAGLLGAGSGVIGPVPIAYVVDMVPSSWYASSLGLYRSLRDLGTFLGAAAAGWIMDRSEVTVPLYLGTIVVLLGAISFGALAPETPRGPVASGLGMGPPDIY